GGAVADRTAALGMEGIGIRRSARPHPSVHRMHSPEALPALLPDADFVLLCAALTPQTRHLMGADEFARMKPGAGFINLSRGGLVDLQALCAGLAAGRPGGAIVDVTAPEPLPPDSPIWDTPGLVITPHVLSDDLEGYIPATLDIFFDNVRRHLEGRPLRNVVDLERGY
ncbi:MAG TPA: NAD(P)-dependent oxidoreductase, partial [Burkholderiaceae bacterium]|nr:NAD(P)-dependent oxidoreductase [Burkholderiaceae bacterium]